MDINKKNIVIGIVGHRDIDVRFRHEIENAIDKAIKEIKALIPNTPIIVLSGLAQGGDQIATKIALQNGAELHVALPMKEEDYINDKDFTTDAKINYFDLKKEAKKVFVVPDIENNDNDTMIYKFRQQAIYVATNCHILLALWNEKEETSMDTACGTAASINFALFNDYLHNEVSNNERKVLEIFSPRDSDNVKDVTIITKYLIADDKENRKYKEVTSITKEILF